MKLILIFLLQFVTSKWCIIDFQDHTDVYNIDLIDCKKICHQSQSINCQYTTSYSYYNDYTNGKNVITNPKF